MNDLIEQFKWALIQAEKYKTDDKAMEYAYKYGLLKGSIKRALIELEYLNLKKS
jgi:hypothetical protein